MTTPACSVVVPAYNARITIASAVRSVLDQSFRAHEVIVVDDGSTDETAAVVEAIGDPRVRLVRQANRGLPGARNAGIGEARAPLVAFLDADDLWMPEYLAMMTGALERDPEAALAFCDAWVFESGTGRVRRETFFDRHRPEGPLPRDPAEFMAIHLRNNFFYVGTTVRRRVLEELGGFREDLTSLEDYELWLRIEASGHPVVEVLQPLALYRHSPGQMSRDDARMAENLLRVCDIVEARPDLPPGLRAVLAARRRGALGTLRALRHPWSAAGLRRRLRSALSATAHRLPTWRVWREQPPEPVTAAFPGLERM